MTEQSFVRQIQRLETQFGKWGEERKKLLWREVEGFSESWFTKAVDKVIGNCRQAPLMSDFYEEISVERERIHRIKKHEHEQDAKDFYSGIYQPDDKRTICQQILAKVHGRVKEDDYKQFIQHLEHAANGPVRSMVCRKCNGTGVILKTVVEYETPGSYASACSCSAGSKYFKYLKYAE